MPEPWYEPHVDDQLAVLIDVHGGGDTAPSRVAVRGDVDSLSADRLREAVHVLLHDERREWIEVDLHTVTFLDSAGIRALLQCRADTDEAGGRLTLIRVPRGVYRVLEIAGLVDHFGLTSAPAADTAWAAWQS